MKNDKVVITGIGVACSLGNALSDVWDALLSGRSGIKPIDGFDARGFACRHAAKVKDIDQTTLGIHPRDARIMDTPSYMLMKCARDAFGQAGIETSSVSGEDIGFFAGMGMVDYEINDLLPAVLKSIAADGKLDYDVFFTQGYNEIYPLWPLSMLNNLGFCQTAINMDIRGENTIFSPHADSGAQAVAEGVKTLLDKKSKIVLAAGVSEKVTPLSLARAHLSGILNGTDGEIAGRCMPFSADRNGTILGEGCGALVLELFSSARERGAKCLGAITGYSSSSEPYGDFSGPAARAISYSMKGAIESSGSKTSDIDLVISHGDGTVIGDKNEIEAIHDVFSERIASLNVFSSKGSLGHLFAAAPVVDIILGISMLQTGIIPATMTSLPLETNIQFNLVNRKAVKAEPKRILINCQSYEGQCASFVIEGIE